MDLGQSLQWPGSLLSQQMEREGPAAGSQASDTSPGMVALLRTKAAGVSCP